MEGIKTWSTIIEYLLHVTFRVTPGVTVSQTFRHQDTLCTLSQMGYLLYWLRGVGQHDWPCAQ